MPRLRYTTLGWTVYTQPATFGNPGQPVARTVTVPRTVGTSEAFAHACHCPPSGAPLGTSSRTAPRAATAFPNTARGSNRPGTTPRPVSTTIVAIRRSTGFIYHRAPPTASNSHGARLQENATVNAEEHVLRRLLAGPGRRRFRGAARAPGRLGPTGPAAARAPAHAHDLVAGRATAR